MVSNPDSRTIPATASATRCFFQAIPAAQREAKESAQKRWRNKQVQHNFDGKDIDQDTRLSCMAGVVYIYIV